MNSLIDKISTENFNIGRPANKFYYNNTLQINENVLITEQYIILCNDQNDPPNLDAGIEIYRGQTNPKALLYWDEEIDKWRHGVEESSFPIAIAATELYSNAVVYLNEDENIVTNENIFIDTNNTIHASGFCIGNASGVIENCAVFQMNSTTTGFLAPKLTSAQKLAITNPANGLTVYDTDEHTYSYYNSTDAAWYNVETSEPFDTKTNIVENYRLSCNGSALPRNIPMAASYTEYLDLSTINTDAEGFSNGVYDGRYIYYCPQTNSDPLKTIFVRYDTTKLFSDTTAYESINLQAVNSTYCKSYNSIVFDGDSYVYLAPSYVSGSITTYMLRYNVFKPFGYTGSYEIFNQATITELGANPINFLDVVAVDDFIYYIPGMSSGNYSYIVKYNTTLSFTSTASYSVFNLASLNSTYLYFTGAVSDGKYLYLSPYTALGVVVRYDIALSFTSSGSYSVYDIATNVNSGCKGFSGCVYDGRYIYFVPFNNGSFSGVLTRYDTEATFAAVSSWSYFDTAITSAPYLNTNSKGFKNGLFDGKYIYLIPNATANGTYSGQITRYDITLDFNTASSYSILDTANVNVGSKGFIGGVYDGKYMYLIPNTNSLAVRILAYAGIPVQHVLGEDIEVATELTTPLIKNTGSSFGSNLNINTTTSGAIIFNASEGVSIGPSPPATDAALDIQSTTKALKLPTLATNLLPTAENNGIMWYSTDAATPNKICICINGAIKKLN